jgi:hypothetical protein
MEPKIRPDTSLDGINRGDRSMNDLFQRIAELKKRPVQAEANPKQFHYNPNEPLHLPPKKEKQERMAAIMITTNNMPDEVAQLPFSWTADFQRGPDSNLGENRLSGPDADGRGGLLEDS